MKHLLSMVVAGLKRFEKIRKGAEKEEGYLYIFILLVNIASI